MATLYSTSTHWCAGSASSRANCGRAGTLAAAGAQIATQGRPVIDEAYNNPSTFGDAFLIARA